MHSHAACGISGMVIWAIDSLRQLAAEKLVDGFKFDGQKKASFFQVRPVQKGNITEPLFQLVVVRELERYLTWCILMFVVS